MAPGRRRANKRKQHNTPCGPFGSHIDTTPSRFRTPTEAEWRNMPRGKMFVTGHMRFRKGDDVILHDPENDKDNRWLAKIKSIRMRQASQECEVWVLVQWYYSAKDLEDVQLQNLDISRMSVYERLMSDREEILNAECFEAVTWVYEFREDDPDSLVIPPNAFFQRYCINTETGVAFPPHNKCLRRCETIYHLTVPHLQVSKAALAAFYHENAFYSRMATPVELAADISHFCPRPECRQWFHEACLVRSYVEDDDLELSTPRGLRLLAVDPDRQQPHPMFERFINRKPARGKTFSSGSSVVATVTALKPTALALPESLIEIAAKPIVRRADCGERSSHGNANDVVLARRLLYQEFEGGHAFAEELYARLCESESATSYSADTYAHVWRSLNVHRILASPYVPYWDKLAGRRDRDADVRALVCPKCTGAI